MSNSCSIFYRLPGKQEINFISGNSKTLNLEKAQNHFVIATFLYPQEEGIMLEMTHSKKLNFDELSQGGFELDQLVQPKDFKKSDYVDLVKKGIAEIKAGSFSKVVLSRQKEITYNSANVVKTFALLCKKYPNAFVHLSSSKFGTWMGATPELLLSKKGNIGKTVSLAGTKKKEQEGWGEKEIEEQDIVTRFIVDNLNIEVENIQVSNQATIQIGPIAHIKKEIVFEHEGSLEKIIEKLHPTPAVCGMPKNASRAFILENETYDRELYTGFIGPMDANNNCSLFVNLRCMQVFENKSHLYLGAGITKDSDAEAEFAETENKSKVILSVID